MDKNEKLKYFVGEKYLWKVVRLFNIFTKSHTKNAMQFYLIHKQTVVCF